MLYQVFPLDGAIAVDQQAVLQAWLRDETGINTNSITFKTGTNAPVTLSDPRLTYTNGVLTYTPATNEIHGALGQTVTVQISVADTLTNQTTDFTWSFQLALPTVPNTSIFYVSNTNSSLVLLSTNGGDCFTYSFTGSSSGITNGTQLVDTNLNTGYTRTVTNLVENLSNHTVVVCTRPTKLAELLQQGSLSSATFTNLSGQSNAFSSFGLRTKQGQQNSPKAFGINYTIDLQHVFYQDANLIIELLAGSQLTFDADLDFSANFNGLKLRQFEATLKGSTDFRLDAHVGATGAHDRGATNTLYKVNRFAGGFVGPFPVWVEVVFEINAGYDLHLEASANYTNGIHATKEISVGRRWDKTLGWTTIYDNPPAGFSLLGPTWQIEASGNLHVFLQPKLTLYLDSVAGVWGDIQPYADLDGHLQLNPYEWELSLYGGLTSTIGLDLRFLDDSVDLPSKTFDLIPRALLWHTNSARVPPQIVSQPQSQQATIGGTVSFNVQASGGTPLIFRWQKNGLDIGDSSRVSGSRSSTLRISNVQGSDGGSYRVRVNNGYGTVTSQNAFLTVNQLAVGLVGYYPFNGNATDASGNGMGGTLNGATFATGLSGGAAQYDGVDDYITLPTTVVGGRPAGTFSAWVFIRSFPRGNAIIASQGLSDCSHFFLAVGSDAKMVAHMCGGVGGARYFTGNPSVSTNAWTMLTFTWDGSYWKLYVNGTLDTNTPAINYPVSNNDSFKLGRHEHSSGPYFLDGLMDEVRIYNRALSTSEIQQLYTPSLNEGLVAYYPFDGNANDASTNGNNASSVQATLTSDRFGNATNAYFFNGSQYIFVPDSLSLRVTGQAISIAAWVYPTNYGSGKSDILRKMSHPATQGGYLLGIRADGGFMQFGGYFNTGEWQDESVNAGAIPLNSWSHVAVTYNGQSVRYFRNGVLVYTSSFTGQLQSSAATLVVGRITPTTSGEFFYGRIDDLRIYNRALSDSEISLLAR